MMTSLALVSMVMLTMKGQVGKRVEDQCRPQNVGAEKDQKVGGTCGAQDVGSPPWGVWGCPRKRLSSDFRDEIPSPQAFRELLREYNIRHVYDLRGVASGGSAGRERGSRKGSFGATTGRHASDPTLTTLFGRIRARTQTLSTASKN
ncbi:unnamed protein product [Ilex paraguariensis]|uniref:Uncharacterized protein n=1 Tax=Ilex paraguariensis TaxID=185542 RepID=A0ABC8TK08_9AQUA